MTATEGPQSHDERRRESITMALYVSISLLAVLLATPGPDAEASPLRTGATVFLTALGLLFAHQMAFRLSTRLLNRGILDEESIGVLKAQSLGGLPVAVVAAAPVLLFGGQPGLLISEVLLLGVVAGVGYVIARVSGGSRRQALVYVAWVIVLVSALLVFKVAVNH